jgi:hypothetical protein
MPRPRSSAASGAISHKAPPIIAWAGMGSSPSLPPRPLRSCARNPSFSKEG